MFRNSRFSCRKKAQPATHLPGGYIERIQKEFFILTIFKGSSAAESISFQMYFSLFVMAVAQVKMAINSSRDIATLLEREEVMPSILKLIEEFNELSSSPRISENPSIYLKILILQSSAL